MREASVRRPREFLRFLLTVFTSSEKRRSKNKLPQLAPDLAATSAISRLEVRPMILKHPLLSKGDEEDIREYLVNGEINSSTWKSAFKMMVEWQDYPDLPPASQTMKFCDGLSLCKSVRCTQWTAAASGSVIILRRSLQVVSPARALCTRPAAIAASLMISQPRASQAAGTVNQTSAESGKDQNIERGIFGEKSAKLY